MNNFDQMDGAWDKDKIHLERTAVIAERLKSDIPLHKGNEGHGIWCRNRHTELPAKRLF